MPPLFQHSATSLYEVERRRIGSEHYARCKFKDRPKRRSMPPLRSQEGCQKSDGKRAVHVGTRGIPQVRLRLERSVEDKLSASKSAALEDKLLVAQGSPLLK